MFCVCFSYDGLINNICILLDMVRTQPYDLISWSAAYFRSISDELEPPSKERLEEHNHKKTRELTKEYLKVLIKQVLCFYI